MADISKIKLPDNNTYDVKDAVARGGMVYYIEANSSDSTAGTWTGTDSRITSYYNGLSIIFVPKVAGASGGTTLNLNGLGAKSCYITAKATKTDLTTHYPAGTPIPMTFYNDEWRIADYYQSDNNDEAYKVHMYYTRYRVNPTYPLHAYCLCAVNVNNQLVPLTKTGGTGTDKQAVDIAFRPDYIFYYSSSTAVAAGGTIAADTLYYATTHTASTYQFNASVPTYNSMYLVGSYNSTTGLFTLDGTSTTSYYIFVPSTAAGITPSSYFVQGKDYILVGHSTSTAGRWSDFLYRTVYHFDGTNLVPIGMSSSGGSTYTGTAPINITGTVISHDASGATAGDYGDTESQTPAVGETFKVPSLSVDAKGHITDVGEHTVTIPEATATSVYNIQNSYGRYYAGGVGVYQRTICALDSTNRLTSLTTTSGTGSDKQAITTGFRPEKLYYSSSAYSAGSATGISAIYLHCRSTYSTNNFNASVPTYNTIYLVGKYSSVTGLFTLDNTSTTSWYLYLPRNSTTGLVSGKDYLRVGQSHSTAGYFQLEMVNTMYHYNGTSLVPYLSYIPQSSTTFKDFGTSAQPNRTITRQGNRVHMSWGDTYSLTSGSWATLTSSIPSEYRPLALERRCVPMFNSLTAWPGYAIVEVSTAGVMRIGSSYTGSAIVQVDMTYDVAIP